MTFVIKLGNVFISALFSPYVTYYSIGTMSRTTLQALNVYPFLRYKNVIIVGKLF